MQWADLYHEGERQIQELAGEREIAARVGGGVGAVIPARALPFLAEQELLVVGSVGESGSLWASMLFGDRGLVTAVTERAVVVDRIRVDAIEDDPLWTNLRVGAAIGLLAIEFSTRRRLRINGTVASLTDERIEIDVVQAYANCPKYIQRRRFIRTSRGLAFDTQPRARGVKLDEIRKQVIERADTFFVASMHPTKGVDVSHRGGEPGFVRLVGPDLLQVPDYRGNSMFNTLGNLVVHDRAGLIFLDHERGRLLQLEGTGAVHFAEVEDPCQPTGGTGRYWQFEVERWLEHPLATQLSWEHLDRSPHNPISAG